jgi:DNA repair protein RadA/Sms
MANKKEAKTIFVCSDCGNESMTWSGKCGFCGSWNTLKEFKPSSQKAGASAGVYKAPTKLSDISKECKLRISTGLSEFDRVLGDGLIKGSLILFAGEPGIGKSTILSQLAGKVQNTLYISAEESLNQIKARFDRLKISNTSLKLVVENDLSNIIKTLQEEKPELLIIDSIQTIASDEFPSTAGSVTQVKECALKLQVVIKELEITTVLVGHVTKGGDVAGPRILEHLVDVVLYLEGERYHEGRILRGIKNRFGPTDEVGIFKITNEGLKEVSNPSELFLSEMEENAPGNAVAVTLEGTRPILVEVQALVSATNFGYPRRTSSGYDLNRLNIIIALLNRRAGINLNSYDVYLNLTGGLKISEPALDLAVAMAITSSYKNKALPKQSCFYGELGLTGEIRKVMKEDQRLKESKKLGFKSLTEKNINELIKKAF